MNKFISVYIFRLQDPYLEFCPFFCLPLHRCVCPVGRTGARCETFIDDCHSAPCHNGGTCIDEGDNFRCLCAYPWAGLQCDIDTDVCFPNPCLHFGTCIPDESLPDGFSCACADGFIGMMIISFVNPNTGTLAPVVPEQVQMCLCREVFMYDDY